MSIAFMPDHPEDRAYREPTLHEGRATPERPKAAGYPEAPLREAPLRNGRASPMLPDTWTVGSFRRDTPDTFTITLRRDGEAFAFRPGQFNMLYAFGVGEVPISISGDPARSEVVVHTIRAVGPVTRALAQLRRGSVIGVRGPFGSSWPVDAAEGHDVVLVAGGIGLPPLRPAFYHLLRHREHYGRITLLYGARTPQDFLYLREVEGWRGRFDVDVGVTVDAAGADWRGNVGVVTPLITRRNFRGGETVAMTCGPEIMMRFAALELAKKGIPEDQIFLSTERNMKCAIGHCGHCQFGPTFICKDGPVFRFDTIAWLLNMREV
jgi:NAD(P)H-flavin reductase